MFDIAMIENENKNLGVARVLRKLNLEELVEEALTQARELRDNAVCDNSAKIDPYMYAVTALEMAHEALVSAGQKDG